MTLDRFSLRETDGMLIVIMVARRTVMNNLSMTGMVAVILDSWYNFELYFSMLRW